MDTNAGSRMKLDFSTMTTVIKDVGFPIFVAVYLLWRMDSLLSVLTGQISKIAQQLDLLLRLYQSQGGVY